MLGTAAALSHWQKGLAHLPGFSVGDFDIVAGAAFHSLRLETNKLRNVAKLFAHLVGTDAISWEVIRCIRLTMEDTTASSRIFIKILFQELAENLGLKRVA